MEKILEFAKVNNTHGIRGEVKCSLWCDDINFVKQLKTVYLDKNATKSLTLVSARPQKNIGILKFAEITTIEQAEELKNKILYCDRDDVKIDDDAYYIADLIGCKVVDVDSGEEYGVIKDVQNYGSCDIYELKMPNKTVLIPAIPDVVKSVDVDNQLVKISVMKGLFD